MKILVVAATRAELRGLYENRKFPDQDFVESTTFDVLITGVGMTATAFALGQYLSRGYSLVINLGIAGSYDYTIPLGSLLQITTDEFSELGAEDKDEFLSIDTLGFGSSRFSATSNIQSPLLDTLQQVNGITVNTVHGNTKSIAAISSRLEPVTESMEGAAVFYCCAQTKTPCIQVRSISNYVEERNHDSWKIAEALKNLNNWAIEFLTKD